MMLFFRASIKRFSPILALAATLLLTACGQTELHSGLTEREANEIVALLLNNNIESEKIAGKETWSVMVDNNSLSDALTLLHAYGLPREQFKDIGQSFEKSGLVSSPTEERIRFMHALSQGIAETISQIDGVITARVHIVLQDNDPLAERLYPSSAAVFIKYRPGSNVPSTQNRIRELVTNSIEGLETQHVSIAFFEADIVEVNPQLNTFINAEQAQQKKTNWTMITLIIILVLLSIGAAAYYYFISQKKNEES